MSAPFFHATHEQLAGDHFILDGEEGRHAVSVRRLRVGEFIDLGDGAGSIVACRVVSVAAPDQLEVAVVERLVVPQPALRFVVVQAIPKGDRGELAVELLTEVGVDAIVPWAASRCVAQWKGERAHKALRRWEATARQASKQSRRAFVPRVMPQATTRDIVAMIGAASASFVLHEEATAPLSQVELPAAGEVVLIVGPEGGVAPDEITAFTDASARALLLGPTVMRTSTAGASALSVLMARSGRWS